MHFYRIIREATGLETFIEYRATLAAAHAHVKCDHAKRDYPDLRIELVDVPSDKAGILCLLNGQPEFGTPVYEAIRTWAITGRGGIKSVANGE